MAVEWKHTTMRLPQDLVAQLDVIAESLDRSRAWVFIKALEAYIAANKKEEVSDE